jgi:hypothetical protein
MTRVSPNHGTAQSSPLTQRVLSVPDRATPAPSPLTKPTPHAQRPLTPLNVNQQRQSRATKEMLNISVTLDISTPSTPTVAVSAITGLTSSHKSQTGEVPTSKAFNKPEATPPLSQTQHNKQAQRPAWKVWVSSIWKGGK